MRQSTYLLQCRCQNLEAQIRQLMMEKLTTEDAAKFLPVVNYYLAGEGGSLRAVIKKALDVDVDEAIVKLDSASTDLLQVGLAGLH